MKDCCLFFASSGDLGVRRLRRPATASALLLASSAAWDTGFLHRCCEGDWAVITPTAGVGAWLAALRRESSLRLAFWRCSYGLPTLDVATVTVRKSAVAQRLKPAGAAGVGLLVLGLNVAMLIGVQRFFPFGTMLGCVLFGAGAFGVAVGEPDDAYGYRPMWFKVGLVAAAIVGLVAGILLNIGLTAD